MVSHAFAALTKKRADLTEKEKGFTLIELLVVVIIIGVLAAIAIPVFLNVQGGAKDSAVKSDLTNAKTILVTAQTRSGGGATLPTTIGGVDGFQQPAGDNYPSTTAATARITYASNGTTQFCFAGVSASGKAFAIDASSSVTENKQCASTGLMEAYVAPSS